MKAMLLSHPGPAEQSPLEQTDLPAPTPGDDEVLLRVHACGLCHTDLHTVEGEISGRLPVVPGHQIVGVVEKIGRNAGLFHVGDRVGMPWLRHTCRECEFCRSGRENLCERGQFTGFHVNGGYAEYAVAPAAFAVPVPDRFDDAHAAPLLCAGIIGYRALRLSNVRPQQTLGLYGFGASAHIAIQIAMRWGCEVFVATRGAEHQRFAKELGATWVGRAEDVPSGALHAAVIFAPAGSLVPEALRALHKGGTLALAGIYMTPIPEMKYERLYHERVVRSVANATRDDARQLMQLAGQIPIRAEVQTFPLADANRALLALKRSEIHGAGVLMI
ncbi:MAG: zinc-dependent alcohol dehydrogenase family protein [Verrucomicrobiia bacterium]|jgi:propanol-preferring alcohol dehydrogenase